MKIKINNSIISQKHPTYFIADIAANHDGDLKRAKMLIDLAQKAGADAVKFQHFNAKTIVSDLGFKKLKSKISHQAKWKKSVYDVYKDASIDLNWTKEIYNYCKKKNIDFFTSPYSIELVDHVDPYIPAYKIGSGDITWHEIVVHIAKKNKPYIIATGASNFKEIDILLKKIIRINKKLILMQCNTNYTASLENFKYINLNVLNLFKKKYPNLILGLSDHTPGHATVLGAVALGAKAIEKHFTDDNNRDGPDHAFSMNFKTWSEMVSRTRELENSMGLKIKKIEKNEEKTVILQRRACRAVDNIKEGELITKNKITYLRPCPLDAFPPYDYKKIINKRAKKRILKGDYFSKENVK